MTNPAVRLASPEDREDWDDLVDRHPASTYCHWFEWQTVLRSAYGKPCFYLCSQEEGRWSGILPLVHMRGRLGGNRLVSMPFLDQGGIVAASSCSAQALRRAAFELLGKLRAKSLELRGLGIRDAANGSLETNRYRFLLALDPSEELLWKSVGPKVRNQIRKSRKEGLITLAVAPSDFGRFYEVFRRNMHDLGSPAHSRALFEGIFSVFGSRARLYLTKDGNGATVGGGIALRFRDTVVVPWASSLRAARPACPNHSLYWKVLQDAGADGARLFDFGRSSVGTGTYHFKKQWRATPEPLVWFSYDQAGKPRSETYLSPQRNSRLAALWRRLPLGLASMLGPWIRGQLPN